MVQRRLLLPVLVCAGLLSVPAVASAQAAYTTCNGGGYQCATIPVPLDRTGAVPGTINLNVIRATSSPAGTPAKEAVLALAGGPGQAAAPLASSFAKDLASASTTRDLLVYDQRGTGNSNPLQCPAEKTAKTTDQFVSECSAQLGAARGKFTTNDSADDIEAIRIASGYDKLVLYGVSYGTKVALAYAAKYPNSTAGLILDSVVTPSGPEALRLSSLRAVPRVLQELCSSDACKGIASDPVGDVRKLAAKLVKKKASGSVYDGRGKRYTATLSEDGLVNVLIAGDLNPALRAELPGSVRAALTGDVKPILRLSARSAGLENSASFPKPTGYQSSAADNDILFFTTTCEEAAIPWTRGAPEAQRETEVINAAKAAQAENGGVFDYRAELGGIPSICAPYPTAGPQPAVAAPEPAVPTLILDGQSDLRTPLEDAQAVGASIPGSTVVAVPHTGHSVLGSDFSNCSSSAITAYFTGQPIQQCPATANSFAPTPRPPSSLSRVTAYRGTRGKAGRTVEAVRLSVNDARRQVVGEALALGSLPGGIGGLRGGYARPTTSGFSLHGYQEIPHVSVSGSIPDKGTAKLRVTGSAAARGSLRVTQSGKVTGTLGGRKISTSFLPRSAGTTVNPWSLGLPTVAQAIAAGRAAGR